MNSISKKLHGLEKNVLPEFPEVARLCVENDAEVELNRKANRIRKRLDFDVLGVWHNDELTFEQKQQETVKAFDKLSEEEKQVVSKDSEFYLLRLQDLLIKHFEATFPYRSKEPMLRVIWFFREMDKLAVAKYMEDSEWIHNRNEDAPDFDDYEWWGNFDALVKQESPDGIFTEATFKRTRDSYDEVVSKAIGKYFREHPEEKEIMLKSSPH